MGTTAGDPCGPPVGCWRLWLWAAWAGLAVGTRSYSAATPPESVESLPNHRSYSAKTLSPAATPQLLRPTSRSQSRNYSLLRPSHRSNSPQAHLQLPRSYSTRIPTSFPAISPQLHPQLLRTDTPGDPRPNHSNYSLVFIPQLHPQLFPHTPSQLHPKHSQSQPTATP